MLNSMLSRTPTVVSSHISNADHDKANSSDTPTSIAQPNPDAPSQDSDISGTQRSTTRVSHRIFNELSAVSSRVMRRNSSLTVSMSKQLQVIFSAYTLLFASGVAILLYVTFLNAFKCDPQQLIKNGYTNPDLHQSLPAVLWFAFMSGTVMVGIAISQCVLTFCSLVVHPAISLSRRQYCAFSLYAFIISYPATMMILYIAPKLRIVSNTVVTVSLCGLVGLTIKNNSKQYDAYNAQSMRTQRIGKSIAKLGLDVSVGFTLTASLVRFGFPALQSSLKALPEGNLFEAIRTGVETLYLYLFFSIARPIWLKRCAHSARNLAMCYNEDMTNHEEAYAWIRLVLNFVGDVFFLIYGRGLLLDMSGTLGFILVFIVATKDVTSRVWNFGFKYMDECIIFSLKMFHPIESQRLGHKWKFVAYIVDDFLRLYSLPRQLAAVWYLTIDYRKVDPSQYIETDGHIEYEEPTTRISVSIKIMDYMVQIHNVPLHFDATPLDAIDESNQISRNSSVSKYTSKVAVAGLSSVVRVATSRAFPYFPVSAAEKPKFQHLCEAVQSIIFQRYQILALAKVFTTFLFLAAPSVAFFTDTRHILGFRSPFGDTLAARKYLACGIFFVVTDVIEWCIVTFGFFIRYGRFHAQVDRYQILLTKNKWMMRTICSFGSFLGIFWFQMAWNSYSELWFSKKFPDVDLADIQTLCYP